MSNPFEQTLNAEQHDVVFADQGPLLVIAGAGSGKTRTLTYRVAHLVQSGVPVERILLCTFTNKAAREMVHRVETYLHHSIEHLWAGTFHHIANRFLRRHSERLGFGTNYTILDQDDSHHVIDIVIQELGYGQDESFRFPKGKALSGLFGLSNSTGESVESIVLQGYPKFENIIDEITEVMKGYEQRKKQINAMDFDDLLKYWYLLLLQCEDVKRYYTEHFLHILVDEYQDTNPLQASIIDKLSSHHGNLTVVGDDAQSIYRFRGADCGHILEFPRRYQHCQTYYLRKNYRSVPEILTVGNRVIAYNVHQFPKQLEAIRDSGSLPVVVIAEEAMAEAHWIVRRIQRLQEQGTLLREIALLYRVHGHSLELQIALQQHGIPFVVRSGMRFFEQAHIKDMMAWLRILYNPRDMVAWQRVLGIFKGIGPATAAKIVQHLEAVDWDWQALDEPQWRKKLSARIRKSIEWLVRLLDEASQPDNFQKPDFLLRLFYEQEYEEYMVHAYDDAAKRSEDLVELIAFASNYQGLERFLSDMMLQTERENLPSSEQEIDGDAVILSTVHQAKGLEWDVVFCVNLVEGSFPFFLAYQEENGLEEERRLFYVATTRAKNQLYLCTRQMGTARAGLVRASEPSRFLWEMMRGANPTRLEYPSGPMARFLLEAEHSPLFELAFA